MSTFNERTLRLKAILDAAKTDLSEGLLSRVQVYRGIARAVPETFSIFVVRWRDPRTYLQAFASGQIQRGESSYAVILQVKQMGLDAASECSEALDKMSENLHTVLQPYAVDTTGGWYDGQLVSSVHDLRPNIDWTLLTTIPGEWWQTETWQWLCKYKTTRVP
jgi:hypothetical protein